MPIEEDKSLNCILTVEDVRSYLSVTRATAYLMLKGPDKLPHLRIGRAIRIRREDLFKWLNENAERQKRKPIDIDEAEKADAELCADGTGD